MAAMKLFWKLDAHARKMLPLLALLTVVLFLRIPNFSEPYWYGDEGIYLTVGNALQDGERLYAEIIDHKTPLIYYFAAIGSQTQFRLLLLGWMLVTSSLFYTIVQKITRSGTATVLSTLAFIIMTSVPWFEGHIPNGELFVMGFVLAAVWALSHSKFFRALDSSDESLAFPRTDLGWLVASGLLFGLAILTKVPAVLDAVAWLSLGWFWLVSQVMTNKKGWQSIWSKLPQVTPHLVALGVGILAPIVLSALYFMARGSGQAYLDFGLLYNFRYAGTWQPFEAAWLQVLFSLPAKLAILTVVVLGLSACAQKISAWLQVALTWFVLALIAATLSNRPYPHYFLQVMPPLGLLLSLAISAWSRWWQTKQPIAFKKSLQATVALVLAGGIFGWVVAVLGTGLYPVQSYYSNFYRVVTGQMDQNTYRTQFNHLMADNYMAAEIIAESGQNEVFIWGTNPMLYALSGTQPTGRFTVSFHIHDFNAYEETFQDLVEAEPELVVVMNDETGTFPEFYEYLTTNYIPNENFQHFSLWKRSNHLVPANSSI